MQTPDGYKTSRRQAKAIRRTLTKAVVMAALIFGIAHSIALAEGGKLKPRPEADMELALTVPDSVRTGDTIVAILEFKLRTPTPLPERGVGGLADVEVLNLPGLSEVIDLDRGVVWQDTFQVGARYVIRHRFLPKSPGWVYLQGLVSSGTPRIHGSQGDEWGVYRFMNGVVDSTRVVAGPPSETEGTDAHGIAAHPPNLPSGKRPSHSILH